MARKVFISFLGFTNYGQCVYCKDEFKSTNTRFIQEATLDYLQTLETWGKDDVAYILLTEGAKNKNWIDDGHIDRNTKEVIRQPGLQTCLAKKNYPFSVEPIEDIPNGNNEHELYEIFGRVYSVLKDGDELYFDITHGFRSLPMLVLVLANYSKFLRNISVKTITYGNYEARSRGNDGIDRAPIVDLLPLSQIQDWTFAAADFLKNGNADRFAELAKQGLGYKSDAVNELADALSVVTRDFQTCRGLNILRPKNLNNLKQCLEKTKSSTDSIINPVLEEVRKAFDSFSTNTDDYQIQNGYEAANWCINHGLYQQAATILQENIISQFCYSHSITINNEDIRIKVSSAFNYAVHLGKMSESKRERKMETIKAEDEQILELTRMALDDDNREVWKLYVELSRTLRNDINHGGMRKEPRESEEILLEVKSAYDRLMKLKTQNKDL